MLESNSCDKMGNSTELMQIISQSFGETATISYADCQEIVVATTEIYRTQEQLYMLLFLVIFGIMLIKWLWNK